MNCARARKLIRRELDERASIEETLWLDQHARECPACAAQRRLGRQMEGALASLPEPASARLDLDRAVQQVNQAIDVRLARLARERANRRRWLIGLGVVAAAAVILMMWSARTRPAKRDVPPIVVRDPVREVAPTLPQPPRPAVADDAHERLDLDRLGVMREHVRDLFAQCMTALPTEAAHDEVRQCVQRFDASVRPYQVDGWPVARIVQGMVSESDAAISRAAVRYLGMRGDALAMEALKDALRSPVLRVDAILALGDAGESGLAALAQATRDASLTAVALEQIVRQKTVAAARVIEKEIVRVSAVEPRAAAAPLASLPSIVRWFDALASMGEVAVPSLLALAASSECEPFAIEALGHTQGARDRVARAVSEPDIKPSVLLTAIASLGVVEAIPYVEQQCLSSAWREPAFACLQALGGMDAWRCLMRLEQRGRSFADHEHAATAGLVARDPELAVRVARELNRDHDQNGAGVLLALLERVDAAAAIPGLLALAESTVLRQPERERALGRVGVIGTREHVTDLRALLARVAPSEHRFAAAIVATIVTLGGESAAESAVADLARERGVDLSRRSTRQLADGLTSRSRIAQVLKPLIQTQSPKTGGSSR